METLLSVVNTITGKKRSLRIEPIIKFSSGNRVMQTTKLEQGQVDYSIVSVFFFFLSRLKIKGRKERKMKN